MAALLAERKVQRRDASPHLPRQSVRPRGLTRPGRAHRDKHRWWRDVALLRNEKQTARLAE